MKRSRSTEQQIAFALRQAEAVRLGEGAHQDPALWERLEVMAGIRAFDNFECCPAARRTAAVVSTA